jgi:hypothetical protein
MGIDDFHAGISFAPWLQYIFKSSIIYFHVIKLQPVCRRIRKFALFPEDLDIILMFSSLMMPVLSDFI